MKFLGEKIAYLRGLTNGIKIENEEQKKVLDLIIDILEGMADTVDDLEEVQEHLVEQIDDIYDDLEGHADEDSFIEISCESCQCIFTIDTNTIGSNQTVYCPNCGTKISYEIIEDEEIDFNH